MKVSILGTEYEVLFKTLAEDQQLEYSDGYTDVHNKKIVIRHYVAEEREEDMSWPLLENENKTTRHELVHAFLFESGMHVNSSYSANWATNEEMVDWMAIQMPKIMKAYESIIAVHKIDVNTLRTSKTFEYTDQEIK